MLRIIKIYFVGIFLLVAISSCRQYYDCGYTSEPNLEINFVADDVLDCYNNVEAEVSFRSIRSLNNNELLTDNGNNITMMELPIDLNSESSAYEFENMDFSKDTITILYSFNMDENRKCDWSVYLNVSEVNSSFGENYIICERDIEIDSGSYVIYKNSTFLHIGVE